MLGAQNSSNLRMRNPGGCSRVGGSLRTMRLHIFLLVLLTVAAFGNVVPGDFILDDNIVIANNKLIGNPANVKAILDPGLYLTNCKKILFERGNEAFGAGESTYRPVATVSYMLNSLFAGQDPRWYRLVNVAIHIANCILLYLFLSLFFNNPVFAFFTAAIFSLHPVNVEVLSCTAFRPNLLAMFFSLSALLLYLRFRRGGKTADLVFSGGAYLLAMFSKEIAVLLPALIVCCDLFREKFSLREVLRYWRAYTVYLICALLFLLVFFLIMTPQQSFSQTQRHLWDNVLRTCDINGFYLKELFYPVDPLFIFPLQIRHSIIRFIFGALAFLAAGYAVCNIRRVPPPAAFGIIWFFLWMAPMNNFFSSFRVAMALRYLYLPLPGFAAVIAYPLWRAWSQTGCFARWKSRFLSYLLPAAVIGSLVMFCIPSNLNWRSEVDLYLALEKKYPGSPFAQLGLGILQARHGQYAEAEKRLTAVLNAGWDIHKNDLAGVYRTLGDIYLRSGRYADAERIFRKMTELFPEAAIVWSDLGGCYALEDRYDQAQEAFQRAKMLRPGHLQAYLKTGLVYLLNGEYPRAQEEFLKLRSLNAANVYPEYDDIAYSLLLEKYAQRQVADKREQVARIKEIKFFIWKGEK